jgi:putative endonuclease
MTKTTTLDQGRHAELACCEFLKNHGLRLLEKNFRGRQGEIDLIMLDKKTLVFVEVRYRKNDAYGGALASVTPLKQHHIKTTAEFFLQQHPQYNNSRIDVVGMSKKSHNDDGKPSDEYQYEWIKNAF